MKKKKSKVVTSAQRMARLIAGLLDGLEGVDEKINALAVLVAGGAVVPPGSLDKILARIALIGTAADPLKAEPTPLLPKPPPEVPHVAP
jgi:hypothetical protein